MSAVATTGPDAGIMEPVWTDRSRAQQLIGRESELGLLRQLVEDRHPVLVAGDAGAGKTRLLMELNRELEESGWRVLVGHCLDFGDTAMPYLPFTEMLRRVAQSEAARADALAEAHPALASLYRSQRGAGEPVDGLERVEIFESLHAMLEDLSEHGPIALIIEDAHWADPSSRDLISFLLARGFSGRVVPVISYRSDDLHRRHPLRKSLADWSRVPGVERVSVGPLTSDDVRLLIGQIAGQSAGSEGTRKPRARREDPRYREDFDRIVARAEGNPFYVEELVGAFLSGGWKLPEDLADLLMVRLDRLDDDARELVREASVAGQRVPHDLLAVVSSYEGRRLDEALRGAIDQHVLVRTDDTYSFRHALLGEAVYDDLLPGERLRLHKAYAEALVSRADGSSPAALARHAQASGDLATALTASVAAGRRAALVGGPDEAARHFQTALELHPRVGQELADAPDIAEIVADASQAIALSGHPDRALKLVEDQLRVLPTDAPGPRRARLLLAKVEAALATESKVDFMATTSEGLSLVGDDAPLRARMLGVHAWSLIIEDDMEGARRTADEALELADQEQMPKLAGDIRSTLGRLAQFDDFGAQALKQLRGAAEDAGRRGDIQGQIVSLYRLGATHFEYAELDEAAAAWNAGYELAVSSGRPWSPFGFACRQFAALHAFVAGEWDHLMELTDLTGQNPPATCRAALDSLRLEVAAGRGEVEALGRLAAVRERWRRDGSIAINSAGASIDLHGLRDGAVAALREYDTACVTIADIWEPEFQARVRLAAVTLGQLVDHAAGVPRAERSTYLADADRLVEEAAQVPRLLAKRQRPFGVEGQAWLARLDAERLHLDWLLGQPVSLDDLLASWRKALDLIEEFGHVYEAARVKARLVAVLKASGDPAALDMARDVARVARRLGATPLVRKVERVASSKAADAAVVLTPREREILTLVAAGRSNGEIGAQLFIATKTASVHVSNILGKLGASTRTEAAAIAQRDGLL